MLLDFLLTIMRITGEEPDPKLMEYAKKQVLEQMAPAKIIQFTGPLPKRGKLKFRRFRRPY